MISSQSDVLLKACRRGPHSVLVEIESSLLKACLKVNIKKLVAARSDRTRGKSYLEENGRFSQQRTL
jgi:hypothetical protein